MSSQLRHEFPTILEALAFHCDSRPDYQVLTWVDAHCKETNKLSYYDLDKASNAVSAHLLKLGCKKSDRVMIAYPFGLEFMAGLFGCMKVGVIGCSIYPPNPTKNVKAEMEKFRGYVEDAGARIALSTNKFALAMKAVGLIYKSKVSWVGTDHLTAPSTSMQKKIQQSIAGVTENDVSFIQYTSGSTGNPKGVVISHQSLVENTKALTTQTGGVPGQTTGALWLPQYHDMGLVAGFMTSVYSGMPLIMASPLDFISKPLLWTDMVEKFKAEITCAPNFAYALLLKRLEQAGRMADWSHVKRAYIAAEPTQPEVVAQVIEKLGVNPENMIHNYGLAETVVFVTGGVAEASSDGLVSCGQAETPTMKLRIVKNGTALPDGRVGTIWVQSLRVASGYYGQEALTTATFKNTLEGEDGHWLNTGDLGKVVKGRLYVTGREKDVIIVNGKNYYPTDIEHSIEKEFHDIIRPGRSAAFQMSEDTIGISVEARNVNSIKQSGVDSKILTHVLQEHGVETEKVLVLAPGAAPKTTSGKLRRSEIRSRTVGSLWDQKVVLLCHIAGQCVHSKMQVSLPKLSGSWGQASDASNDHFVAVFKAVTGKEPAMNLGWADNGLTSVKTAELARLLQQIFHVDLPTNFVELYPTPLQLFNFMQASKGTPFKVSAYQSMDTTPTLSKTKLAVLQGVGILAIILLLSLCFLPSFFIGREISELAIKFQIGSSGRYATWNCLPIVVPVFCFSLTTVIITLKWLVVGKYKPQEYQLHSWNYLRWWFVDRMLEMWEIFVGRFFLETKLLWLVYHLLGAHICPSVEVNAFIREFDLVQIGSKSKLKHQLLCRKLRQWDDGQVSPVMVIRPISIGSNSIISGFIGPGCQVGSNCKVESLSAIAEGSIVPDAVVATGSPAYNAGLNMSESSSNSQANWRLDVLKLTWMTVELYLYFGQFLAAQVVVNEQLPQTWRYTPLLYWFLVLLLTALFGIFTSIAMKWTFIGKRQAGARDGVWSKAAIWICDYHFRLCQLTLMPFLGFSKFWMVVFKLHGLDTDFRSVFNGNTYFLPSMMDLIKIHRSFVSSPVFDIDAEKGMIEIIDSSVGWNSRIYSGVQIIRSTIPPKTAVRESVFDSNQKTFKRGTTSQLALALLGETAQIVLNVAIFFAFIPAFEVFTNTVYGASTGVSILGLGGSLIAHAVSLNILLRVVQSIALNLPSWSQSAVFGVYIVHAWANKGWNFWFLLHGTPMFTYWLYAMGAEVNGNLWYFGYTLYDMERLHFVGERMIVDGSNLHAHFVVADELAIEDTYVRGLVHPCSYAHAGANLPDREHEPYTVFHSDSAHSSISSSVGEETSCVEDNLPSKQYAATTDDCELATANSTGAAVSPGCGALEIEV